MRFVRPAFLYGIRPSSKPHKQLKHATREKLAEKLAVVVHSVLQRIVTRELEKMVQQEGAAGSGKGDS
jgi:hypothetical protein